MSNNQEERITALEYKITVLENAVNNLGNRTTSLETGKSNDILSMVYPVGAIYMSVTNVSPAIFLGGQWERWGAGKMPVAYSQTDAQFMSPEATGGSKTSVATHSHNTTNNISTGSLTLWHACYEEQIPTATGLVGLAVTMCRI